MMLEQRDLEEALNDANAGLEKCLTVMEFMRRRQAIEDEYTRALSTTYHLLIITRRRKVVHIR